MAKSKRCAAKTPTANQTSTLTLPKGVESVSFQKALEAVIDEIMDRMVPVVNTIRLWIEGIRYEFPGTDTISEIRSKVRELIKKTHTALLPEVSQTA